MPSRFLSPAGFSGGLLTTQDRRVLAGGDEPTVRIAHRMPGVCQQCGCGLADWESGPECAMCKDSDREAM